LARRCSGPAWRGSSLSHERPAGERVDFDEAVGYAALRLVGRYPQPHMKHRPGRELCLSDKRTRTAPVTAADQLLLKKPCAACP